MRIKKILSLFILTKIFFYSANSFSEEKILRFCGDEQDNWPWLTAKKPYIMDGIIQNIQKNLDIEIKLDRSPWLRCLKDLQFGKYDGVLNASYKEERLKFGVYPTTVDGKIDESKKIQDSSYSLYILKTNNDIKWDGKTLTGLTKPIMITLGYSIKQKLSQELKATVIERNLTTREQFLNLADNLVDGVANLDLASDHILKNNPKLNEKIIKLTPPLESKAYYLILSHQLLNSNPKLAHKIWENIKEFRSSSKYSKIVKQVMDSSK